MYKQKLFDLFNNCCFKCGAIAPLHLDHHIPAALGGEYKDGNFVVLCRRCNSIKSDYPPTKFYSVEELNRLKPLLEKQSEIMAFTWEWDKWNKDKRSYLLSILPVEVVDAILNEMESNSIVFRISAGSADKLVELVNKYKEENN